MSEGGRTTSRAEDPAVEASSLGAAYAENERFLWGLCYRMTGSAADADDLVQATFVRALESPPPRTDQPWRPWLTRVAVNLGRDLLRRRKRRAYVGPWLPSPIETGGEADLASYEPTLAGSTTTEGRYDLLESVSFAFLLALEALTPKQRAVLLLRDVFDYSVAETADALAVSEPDVKTTHHRARRAMEAYDRARRPPDAEIREQTRRALEEFVGALSSGDFARAEKMLASSVRMESDGAGEFFAARVPVIGAGRVIKFYRNVLTRHAGGMAVVLREANGLPALFMRYGDPRPRHTERLVTSVTLDRDGRIERIYAVLASRKLTALAPGAFPAIP